MFIILSFIAKNKAIIVPTSGRWLAIASSKQLPIRFFQEGTSFIPDVKDHSIAKFWVFYFSRPIAAQKIYQTPQACCGTCPIFSGKGFLTKNS